MGAALGYEECPSILGRQVDRHMISERRGIPTDVDHDVPSVAFDAPDEFRLSKRLLLPMHSTDSAPPRADRDIHLADGERYPGMVEAHGIVRLSKDSALVHAKLHFHDVDARDLSFREVHGGDRTRRQGGAATSVCVSAAHDVELLQ